MKQTLYCLKPSEFFYDIIVCFIEIMRFEGKKTEGIYFWIVSPLMPAIIFGCYLADILFFWRNK